jgi:hypothetical protein
LYPEHENNENNGREKEIEVKWVEGWKRKEKNYVVRRMAVGKMEHRQGWDRHKVVRGRSVRLGSRRIGAPAWRRRTVGAGPDGKSDWIREDQRRPE